jgi:hypothetical protein
MTVQMGYAMLTSEALQTHAQGIRLLLGNDPLCAWLEDPLDEHGLSLRENVDPGGIVLQPEGLVIPEHIDPAVGPAVHRRWPQGRLFNTRIDMQWERMPQYLHLVVISDEALPAPFEGCVPLEAIDEQPCSLLLWGTYNGQRGWTEGRIPSLEGIYPLHWSGPYAAIIARAYEAEWVYDQAALPTARVVTRYLRYDGNYDPQQDPRFK